MATIHHSQSGISLAAASTSTIAPLPELKDQHQQKNPVKDDIHHDRDIVFVEPSPKLSPTSENGANPNIVTWDSPNDPTNPHNWSFKRRWFVTVLISINNLCVYVQVFLFPTQYSTYDFSYLVGRIRHHHRPSLAPLSNTRFTLRKRFPTLSQLSSSLDMCSGQYSGAQARKCSGGEQYSFPLSLHTRCSTWARASLRT